MINTLLLQLFIFAQLVVGPNNSDHNSVTISLPELPKEIVECIDASLEGTIRFETRLCKKRGAWFDSCKDPRIEIRSIKYDPVRQDYQIVSDVLGDIDRPKTTSISSRQAAINKIRQIEMVSLKSLPGARDELLTSRKSYLDVKVSGRCKGEGTSVLATIATIATFGMVEILGFDTGWNNFNITELQKQ